MYAYDCICMYAFIHLKTKVMFAIVIFRGIG